MNFNDPKQTRSRAQRLVSKKAYELLKAAGAKRALPLPVPAPLFHSSP